MMKIATTCIAAFASFTLTTRQPGIPATGFVSVLALGRSERLKTVLMGTNTPHAAMC